MFIEVAQAQKWHWCKKRVENLINFFLKNGLFYKFEGSRLNFLGETKKKKIKFTGKKTPGKSRLKNQIYREKNEKKNQNHIENKAKKSNS